MNKVAIFGNAGAGKSTLAKALANKTKLPLVSLDLILYRSGGAPVPQQEYLKRHAELLEQEQWIIDGFGSVPMAWQRFEIADTLIFIDLPLWRHYLWVGKRFFKSLFVTPEGWPERSPIFKSTYNSLRVVWLCHRQLTPRYRKLIAEQAVNKQVYHLRSPKAIEQLLNGIEQA